jgi:hypothetical protein
MVFIVETGNGIPNANAYAPTSFVDAYLADRARSAENSWQSLAGTRKQQAVVVASSYIDSRWGPRFKGTRLRTLVPGRAAFGTLMLTALPLLNETATVGLVVYRFVDTLAQANDVLRGATVATAATNLTDAINSGASTTSHPLTIANYEATAEAGASWVTVTAVAEGTSGNEIAFATNVTGASGASGKLANGLDEGPQGLLFPRAGIVGWDGAAFYGIPWKLKAATAEYAVRSLVAMLAPDLTRDASGALVQRKREKVGPIEEETEFAPGAQPRIFADYPEADRLLLEFLTSAGGVIRG